MCECFSRNDAYLVGLVVVLWVVLKDLGPLLVVKGAHQLLYAHASVLGPPLFAVHEPGAVSIALFMPTQVQCSHLLR
jgi:hypothetical protein